MHFESFEGIHFGGGMPRVSILYVVMIVGRRKIFAYNVLLTIFINLQFLHLKNFVFNEIAMDIHKSNLNQLV
jgi:hypothetical protein